jgi:uncharacterized protein affecting Mg2+/Co2+ transport
MKIFNKNIGFLFLAVFLAACVDIYDPKLTSDKLRLVVESQLTTKLDYQYVYLTYDAPYNSEGNNFKNLVTRAKVKITDDQGKVFEFYDEIANNNQIKTREGYNYRSVNKFKAELGRKYKLSVEVLDGRKYESSLESVVQVSKIDRVSTEFRESPPPTNVKGQFSVFIDTQDSPTEKNFYKWDSYHVKQINYCREWYIFGSGGSVTQSFVDKCCEPCYEKVKFDDAYELANDRLINGNKIVRKYVATVPFDNTTPYYMIINQYSLTEDAYKFWNAVKEQSKNSGGLFDATPKSIKGNIKNINDTSEEVLGIFYVSDVYEHQINIDRNLTNPKPIIIEPYSLGWVKTDQCYPCQESYNRTKTKPAGFLF